MGPTNMIPALFTSASSGPSRSVVASRKAPNESSSVTSSSKPAASPGSDSAAASAADASRSPIATRCPRMASACAVASPIPRAAPVIATTFDTAGTLGSARLARRSHARGRRWLCHGVVALALPGESDGPVGLEYGIVDVGQAVDALPLRHREELRPRDLLVPQRTAGDLAVLDQIGGRALEHPVGKRVPVGKSAEEAVQPEEDDRADDRARHRVVVAD